MWSRSRLPWAIALLSAGALWGGPAAGDAGGTAADLKGAVEEFYGTLVGREVSHRTTRDAMTRFFASEDDLAHYLVDLLVQIRNEGIARDRLTDWSLEGLEVSADGRAAVARLRLKGARRIWFSHWFDRDDPWKFYGGAWHVVAPERLGRPRPPGQEREGRRH